MNICVNGYIVPRMGCCLCHPSADVEQDLTTSFHTTVGDIAIVHGITVTSIKGCCNGIMYVKGDSLYYETRCGKNYLCCMCCKQKNFKLSAILSVEVVQNEAVTFNSRRGEYVNLSPGLKISADPNTLILVAVPDASSFAKQLLQACNPQENDGF